MMHSPDRSFTAWTSTLNKLLLMHIVLSFYNLFIFPMVPIWQLILNSLPGDYQFSLWTLKSHTQRQWSLISCDRARRWRLGGYFTVRFWSRIHLGVGFALPLIYFRKQLKVQSCYQWYNFAEHKDDFKETGPKFRLVKARREVFDLQNMWPPPDTSNEAISLMWQPWRSYCGNTKPRWHWIILSNLSRVVSTVYVLRKQGLFLFIFYSILCYTLRRVSVVQVITQKRLRRRHLEMKHSSTPTTTTFCHSNQTENGLWTICHEGRVSLKEDL